MNVIYVHVNNGVVVNISNGDTYKPWNPPEGITIVELQDLGDISIGDLYDGSSFSKPPMVYPETFQDFVIKEISRLDAAVRDYVYTRYASHRQISLTKLQMDARSAGKTAADTYVQLCWNWMQVCFGAYYTAEDQILTIANDNQLTEVEKRTTISAVINEVDYSSLTASDPVVTIRHTMELLS